MMETQTEGAGSGYYKVVESFPVSDWKLKVSYDIREYYEHVMAGAHLDSVDEKGG